MEQLTNQEKAELIGIYVQKIETSRKIPRHDYKSDLGKKEDPWAYIGIIRSLESPLKVRTWYKLNSSLTLTEEAREEEESMVRMGIAGKELRKVKDPEIRLKMKAAADLLGTIPCDPSQPIKEVIEQLGRHYQQNLTEISEILRTGNGNGIYKESYWRNFAIYKVLDTTANSERIFKLRASSELIREAAMAELDGGCEKFFVEQRARAAGYILQNNPAEAGL
ncbi:MAG TPA: hypothetical protein VF828_03725 [Patescibacteria group bacterium]